MTASVGRCSVTELADGLARTGRIISHDRITRMLAQEHYHPSDLWAQARQQVRLKHGYLIIDDTVIRKPDMKPEYNPLVKYYWTEDGQQRGINLITLVWSDGKPNGQAYLIDAEIIDPERSRNKNEIARELLDRAHNRGFTGITVLFDAWYRRQNLAFH